MGLGDWFNQIWWPKPQNRIQFDAAMVASIASIFMLPDTSWLQNVVTAISNGATVAAFLYAMIKGDPAQKFANTISLIGWVCWQIFTKNSFSNLIQNLGWSLAITIVSSFFSGGSTLAIRITYFAINSAFVWGGFFSRNGFGLLGLSIIRGLNL